MAAANGRSNIAEVVTADLPRPPLLFGTATGTGSGSGVCYEYITDFRNHNCIVNVVTFCSLKQKAFAILLNGIILAHGDRKTPL